MRNIQSTNISQEKFSISLYVTNTSVLLSVIHIYCYEILNSNNTFNNIFQYMADSSCFYLLIFNGAFSCQERQKDEKQQRHSCAKDNQHF